MKTAQIHSFDSADASIVHILLAYLAHVSSKRVS
jgi:hypothetical protein